MSNKQRLRNVLKQVLDEKMDAPQKLSGLLGITISGRQVVGVHNKPGFVYVRLRDNLNEVIEAFNETVNMVYDLPVVVIRDKEYPNFYRVVGRDIGRYSTWGSGGYGVGSQVGPHGNQHSFGDGSGAGWDIVWVYKRQFTPLLCAPLSGSYVVRVMDDYYRWGDNYQHFTGAYVDLQALKPVGTPNSRFVTLYLHGDSNTIRGITGSIFDRTTYTPPLEDYIPVVPGTVGIPVNAVLLNDTDTGVDWSNLYDIRVFNGGGSFSGTFLGLGDTPSSYYEKGGYLVAVKNTEDGLTFISGSFGDVYTKTELQTSGSSQVHYLNLIENPWSRTNEPTGFENRTDSTLSFNNSTRTLTVSPTGSSFNIFIKGVRYQSTGISIQISNNIGIHYIYYDLNGNLIDSLSPWIITQGVPIATVYWTGSKGIVGDERHGIIMDSVTHEYLHETIGTRYASGLAGSFSGSTAVIGAGEWYDEDIEMITTSGVNSFRVLFRTGSNWDWTNLQTKPYHEVSDIIQYDNSGVLTNVSNNFYVAYWVFASNITDSPFLIIMGQRQDNNLANARNNNTLESLSFGSIPSAEMKCLYRLLYQRNGTSEVYIEALDFRSSSNVPVTSYVATDHGTLTGLTDPDHPASAIYTDATTFDGLLSGTSTVQESLNILDDHNHDPRYYTEAELQTSGSSQVNWGNIIDKPTFLSGTGSSGYVAYWNGVSSLAYSPSLYWDASNNWLGVGTSSPERSIHTTGRILMKSSSFQAFEIERTTNNEYSGGLMFKKQRSGSGVLSGDQLARFMAMAMTSSGVYPSESTNQDFLTVEATENHTSTAQGRRTSFYVVANGATSTTLGLQVRSNGVVYVPGTLGIGTTSVTGDADIWDASGATLTLSRNDTIVNAGDLIGKIQGYSNDVTLTTQNIVAAIEIRAAQAYTTDAAAGYISFLTTPNSAGASPTEKVRINASGSLLVGTTTDGMTANGSLAIAQDLAHRGSYVGFYNVTPIARPTTAGSSATFVANSGTTINSASTFDGYTLAQVVRALRNLGLLT